MSLETDKKLTFEEFRERLYQKLAELTEDGSLVCPICKRDGPWTAIGYSEVSSKFFDDTESGIFTTFPVICDSCGFVAQFAVKIFEEE